MVLAVEKGLVVMTYARCGATWFAQMLGSTGCLGRPEDWFNGEGYRNRGLADYPLDRKGQLAVVHSSGRSPNGVAGVKLSVPRLLELEGFDWTSGLGELHFIHLVRRDRLDRAISDHRAQQTGQYRSTSHATGQPRYDRDRIEEIIEAQAREEAAIRRYFAVNGIIPLELAYEDIVGHEAETVRKIADWMGLDAVPSIDPDAIELEIQRDEINEAWRERFLAETRSMSHFAPLPTSRWAHVRQRIGMLPAMFRSS